MDQSLLCSCVSSSTSDICIMNLTSLTHNSICLWSSPPIDCALPCCSLASLAFFPCLLALAMPQLCRDSEGGPNVVRLGNQIDRAWKSAPCLPLHPLTAHHPAHQPLRRSLAIALVVFFPSPHPMHA
jgi:hypothetical protein